jgi:hypothetical protein
MKCFIILTVFFVFSLQAQTSGLKPAAEYLMSNSRTLINAISNCDSLTMKAVGYDCNLNHAKGNVLSLLENNKKEYTEKEYEKIVQLYMRYIPWITYAISSSPIISDSITIRFVTIQVPFEKWSILNKNAKFHCHVNTYILFFSGYTFEAENDVSFYFSIC